MSLGSVLIVDDEETLRQSASEWLALSGFETETAAGAPAALARLAQKRFDALISDVRMPGMDGLALLEAALKADPGLPVILLTGHGDIALAVEAMRAGAHDFLEKPYDADHLVVVLRRAVATRRMNDELERLRESAGLDIEQRFVGVSRGAAAVRERLAQLRDLDIDVLLRGETGAGKEVAARALHDLGKRRHRPFVAINCAAVPEAIFESEMFGHDRGAFTGAAQKRVGRIEHADGGTVFLDEIDAMPLPLQARMLRVIQERVVEPLGANRQVPVDIRFVAATKVDLKAESDAGRFRADLYFRLSTIEVSIPPLNRRRDDIALLFRHFAAAAARRHGLDQPRPAPALLAALGARDWPGNVRELKAAAERFALGLPIDADEPRGDGDEASSLPDRVAAFEARLIQASLDAHGGNAQAAAGVLGIPLRTLNEKIARHGLRGRGVA
jgi:two-component system C4-dicarboxylate transport response regulator DctD